MFNRIFHTLQLRIEMGWKNVKEHYRIGHYVQVTDEGICIGSGYVHNIIVIGLDGAIKKRYDSGGNDDLLRYQREIDADPRALIKLIQSPDAFTDSVLVYTYNGGDIIEKQCETPGWPNVTHDGDMMYDNAFSTDKAIVIEWAKVSAKCAIKNTKSRIIELKKQLDKLHDNLSIYQVNLEKLEVVYHENNKLTITEKVKT
ncbi:MAG: hypothetical protein ACXWT0_00370 [Methylobacter sp.]